MTRQLMNATYYPTSRDQHTATASPRVPFPASKQHIAPMTVQAASRRAALLSASAARASALSAAGAAPQAARRALSTAAAAAAAAVNAQNGSAASVRSLLKADKNLSAGGRIAAKQASQRRYASSFIREDPSDRVSIRRPAPTELFGQKFSSAYSHPPTHNDAQT